MSQDCKKEMIHPIAIDFGAKKTGVYYAFYQRGSKISEIKKNGEVLKWGNYTSLLGDRTAYRHARRNEKRRKLAKKLLDLILIEYFEFPASDHTQALGFFINRRGFNRLETSFSKEYLDHCPSEVLEYLPDATKNKLQQKEANKLSESLEELVNKGKIQEIWQPIEDKIKEAQKEESYWDDLIKIKKAIEQKIENLSDKIKDSEKGKKLSKIPRKVIERAIQDGVAFKKDQESNVLDFLNNSDQKKLQYLKESLPQDIDKKHKKAKNNQWNFKPASFQLDDKTNNILSFDIDENETDQEKLENYQKIHLKHLCFAIYKINEVLESGHRHRNKYFEEVKEDLENLSQHEHQYLKDFAKVISNHPQLDNDQLYRLIAHISNFELKPLRKYFNQITDQKGLKNNLDLKKLQCIFDNWILHEWRISESDGEEKQKDYQKLKQSWKEHKNKKDPVIDFWLKTNPNLTIPPYQDIKNRRPPHCQTLLLNKNYLDKNYPQWKQWLKLLQQSIIKEYEQKLKGLKNKAFLSDDEIAIRKLQLIFDRSKALDEYKLNEIWSQYHAIHQEDLKPEENQNIKTKYKQCIEDSTLPSELKEELLKGLEKPFKQSTFGHLINKYYQTRKKAREGRYFLHQIKNGKVKKNQWSDEDKLLTICNHRPRQKKHQIDVDLATIFGLEISDLRQIVGISNENNSDKKIKAIENWFEYPDFKGLKTLCNDATKTQKDYGGSLKYKIDIALSKESSKQTKKDKDLVRLSNKAKDLSKKLAEKLWPKDSGEKQECRAKRFETLFSFAQIHNIVFKDRSGFAKTCPVCSLDNSERMKQINEGVIACRLSGLSIRLIDGAVMKICDRLSNHIALKVWLKIKKALKQNQNVCIPLILEQNHFAFEPTLEDIKGRKKKDLKDNRTPEYNEKIKRIKEASQNICPYRGTPLGDSEEIDHIIPQASRYGILNDEANLIYVSRAENALKTDTQYSLSELNKEYKKQVFNLDIDNEEELNEKIKEYIYKHLVGEGDKRKQNLQNKTFIFGKYQNFIRLNEDQQKAFRHAIFLKLKPDSLRQKPDDLLLRKMVIHAIDNRNRAIVNGTQRYLAQVLADRLHCKAQMIKKEKLLSFDYFEYSSEVSNNKSIYNLRNFYLEEIKKKEDQNSVLEKHNKERGAKQEDYSHLLDAQMAFLLACEDHRDNGTMGITFDKPEETIRQGIDCLGQVDELKMFHQTQIPENTFFVESIDRRKSKKGCRPHRSFTRSTYYADHYLHLLIKKENNKICLRLGFDWSNSVEFIFNSLMEKEESNKKASKAKKKGVNESMILECLKFAHNNSLDQNIKIKSLDQLYEFLEKKCGASQSYYFIRWDKSKLHKYFIEHFSNAQFVKRDGPEWWDEITKFFMDIHYRTERKNVIDGNSKLQPIKKDFEIKIEKKTLTLPVKEQWNRLHKDWEEKRKQNPKSSLKDFLEAHPIFKNQKCHQHQKVRKMFSLPVLTSEGHTLQKRTSWNKKPIYQIWSDSDSREDHNKFSSLAISKGDSKSALKKVVNKSFRSKKQFKLTLDAKNFCLSEYKMESINPNIWFEIRLSKENPLKQFVKKLEYQIDNVTRPKIKLTPIDQLNDESIQVIQNDPLTKARTTSDLDKLKEINQPIEYIGSSLNEKVKQALLQAVFKNDNSLK